jgi:divalent metal cation (Fe/Co/Zn/Cd) transporter
MGMTLTRLETLKSLVALIAGFTMLYLGYRFFAYSVMYLAEEPPRVTAGLMAGLAGFTFTAAAVTLLRDWIILERLPRGEGKK